MTTQKQAEECSGAYVIGEMDFDDGFESRPLHHFTRLDQIEAYLSGYADAKGTTADGALQRMIDYGAELQDLQDGRDDEEWIRRGC
jgi:hypothetical protein